MSCAPKNKGKRSYTCLPRESLLKIVADYNKTHNDKIKMSKSNKNQRNTNKKQNPHAKCPSGAPNAAF